MNHLFFKTGISLLALTTLTAFFGCKTTGNERSTDTRTSMKIVESDIAEARAQIDLTSSSLSALLAPEQIEVQKAFSHFSGNVSKMEEAGARLLKHTHAMSTQRAEYFAEWSKDAKTYQNQELRTASERRRSELDASFARISQANVGIEGALQSYLTDVRDLRTFLSSDLSPRGLSAVRPSAEKTIRDGDSLSYAIQPVQSAINEARQQLTPGSTVSTY